MSKKKSALGMLRLLILTGLFCMTGLVVAQIIGTTEPVDGIDWKHTRQCSNEVNYPISIDKEGNIIHHGYCQYTPFYPIVFIIDNENTGGVDGSSSTGH